MAILKTRKWRLQELSKCSNLPSIGRQSRLPELRWLGKSQFLRTLASISFIFEQKFAKTRTVNWRSVCRNIGEEFLIRNNFYVRSAIWNPVRQKVIVLMAFMQLLWIFQSFSSFIQKLNYHQISYKMSPAQSSFKSINQANFKLLVCPKVGKWEASYCSALIMQANVMAKVRLNWTWGEARPAAVTSHSLDCS